MRATVVTAVAVLAATNAGCGGSHSYTTPAAAAHNRRLAGQVQVVWYSSDDVRICPFTAELLAFGPPTPPPCADGPRAVGIDTSLLTEHAPGQTEHWGHLYLVVSYHAGVFSVTSQSPNAPPVQPPGPSLDEPPCATPPGGWLLAGRTDAQQRALSHYSKLAGHHDLVDISFFDHGLVLTVASRDPARTRRVLGLYWPRQLCVVKAHYTRATLVAVGKRMVHLMTSPHSAAYGWITGAGGTCASDSAQPTTCVEVLVETPQLRALVRQLPEGIVVVEPALRPVGPA
jgi:hypothetical protein